MSKRIAHYLVLGRLQENMNGKRISWQYLAPNHAHNRADGAAQL